MTTNIKCLRKFRRTWKIYGNHHDSAETVSDLKAIRGCGAIHVLYRLDIDIYTFHTYACVCRV